MQSGIPIGRMVPRQPPSTLRRATTLRCQDPACAYPGGAPLRRGKGPYARKCDACEERATTRRLERESRRRLVDTEDPTEYYDWAEHDRLNGKAQRAAGRDLSMEERIRSGKYDWCPLCKKTMKRKKSAACRACRSPQPGERYSDTCVCGATKNKGAFLCYACRYPDSERAREARRERAA